MKPIVFEVTENTTSAIWGVNSSMISPTHLGLPAQEEKKEAAILLYLLQDRCDEKWIHNVSAADPLQTNPTSSIEVMVSMMS